MAVKEELAALCSIQEADTEIARRRAALASLDTGEERQAELAAAERELTGFRDRCKAVQKEQLDGELELRTLEEKRAKFQGQLYGGTVRNPRQLSDLQEEVQMLSQEIGKIEERVLALMDSLEELRSEVTAREARLAELGEQLSDVRQKYQTTSDRLNSEIRDWEAKRESLAVQVGPQLLKRYEQIRIRQGNLGLVRVTGDSCPGCRIAFPSDVVKALKNISQVLNCDNCGRLLYWDETTD